MPTPDPIEWLRSLFVELPHPAILPDPGPGVPPPPPAYLILHQFGFDAAFLRASGSIPPGSAPGSAAAVNLSVGAVAAVQIQVGTSSAVQRAPGSVSAIQVQSAPSGASTARSLSVAGAFQQGPPSPAPIPVEWLRSLFVQLEAQSYSLPPVQAAGSAVAFGQSVAACAAGGIVAPTTEEPSTSASGWPGYILNGSGIARPTSPTKAERDELIRKFRIQIEIDRKRKQRQTEDELVLVDLL